MGLLTVQQLQALGGNSLLKPVTVKCFFVSEERWRELVGVGGKGREGRGRRARPGPLYEPD